MSAEPLHAPEALHATEVLPLTGPVPVAEALPTADTRPTTETLPTETRTVLRTLRVAADDPLAAPLLADLEREYDSRYGLEFKGEPASVEINRYPPDAFAPPHGAFIVLLDGEDPISGGAFMRYDDHTAEFKRVWTHPDHRGRGLAGQVLVALEHEAVEAGYDRVYLTTGPKQPEAVALYLKNGYTPLFDPQGPQPPRGKRPFVKILSRA
ncbi:GNAT family N-acetyltransferase [Brevibacterium yomogidense]|uniref:GNAT family N-acetyltransferase n=1 Tax=Brevibacterium yomogidense TaxID=946573 RepID=UPI001E36D776|nr:GNAT family N-acetyltransferase [Brevibacterium yomogidense]